MAARPEHRGRGRTLGHAYRRELYEQIVEELLAEASVGAPAIASVVGEVNRAASPPDHSLLDRIARERERAMACYLQDRDAEALQRTMTRLDQEQAAAETRERWDDIPADVAVRYVQDLPETWRKAEGGSGRQLLASALFDRIDVLGIREATVHLSAHAVRRGLAAALPQEVGILVSGRGERARTYGNDIVGTVRVVRRHLGGTIEGSGPKSPSTAPRRGGFGHCERRASTS